MLSLILRTPSSSSTLVYSHYVLNLWEEIVPEGQNLSDDSTRILLLTIHGTNLDCGLSPVLPRYLLFYHHSYMIIVFFLFFSPSNKCYFILPSAFVSAFFQHTIDFHLSLICMFLSRLLMPTIYFSGVKRKWLSF